jgi:hypothetical protein
MRTVVPSGARRIRTRGRALYPIFSQIPGRRAVILSMKHQIEKRHEGMMKFFKPELYIRYNSPDDAEADRADEEWEKAIGNYKIHLSKWSNFMNGSVKELAKKLCLHDAEVLSIQENLPDPSYPPLFYPFPVATIFLTDNGNNTNLVYFLWDEIGESCPKGEWPFSKLRTHWLYDEIDVEQLGHYLPRYWHRILLSDGRVVSIPFFDVIIQTFAEQNSATAIITKKRA